MEMALLRDSLFILGIYSAIFTEINSKCVFDHNIGDSYTVEQKYDNSETLIFEYTCQSKKFNVGDKDFFYYQLESCKASNISYAPGDTWRQGPFLYECFFSVTKEQGSVSEVRHIGCYVQDYLIMKDNEALLGNYRFACDDLGLHPVSCVTTKEGLELKPAEKVEYGLDNYNCKETGTGLSLEEKAREAECQLSGDVAIAYLIDTSESVKEALFDNTVKPAIAAEIAALPDDYKVRLVTYSTDWEPHGDWIKLGNSTRDLAEKKVMTLPFMGEGTKTAGALQKTAKLFENIGSTSARIVVLVTDGEARDVELIPEAAKEMAANSIKVISVGVGDEINSEELAMYGDTVITLENLEGLKTALIGGEIRCKIFERTIKVQHAQKQCTKWAEEDIPMERDFLPACPPSADAAASNPTMRKDISCSDTAPLGQWGRGWQNCKYNQGAAICYHTKIVGIRYGGEGGKIYRSRNQCCYDADEKLITDASKGAGTAQKASQLYAHIPTDIQPAEYCREAGMLDIFLEHRPVGKIA